MSDEGCFDNDQSKRDVPSFIEPRPPLILNPFMRPRPQKATNLMELFEEDSECEEQEWVQVYLRLKPCNTPSNLYEVRSNRCLITSVDMAPAGHGRRTQHNISKMYTFSHIFRPESSQKEIFEHVVKGNLKKLPEGHNFTLLTYGASGSGKTYTLMGTVASPGLVPRSLEYVFRLVEAAQQPLFKPMEGGAEKLAYHEQEYELQWVKRLRSVSAPLKDKYKRMSAQLRNDLTASTFDLSNRTRYYVWVSFIEIYNEAIYDLLSNSDRSKASSKLRIREDANGHVYVKGASQAFVRSGQEAYDVLVAGKHQLQVAATGVHAHSSRSHCIFTITMLTETENGVRESCVRLCDLAGSERAVRTRNTGARMQESRAINSSLHVLERCLHMLRRKQRNVTMSTLVPYRESKLTRLLGAGLCGSRLEAVSMVVTLNPAPQFTHETRHVLQLAAVARDIQVNNTVVETTFNSSTQDTIAVESGEIVKLRADNERLHFELVQAQSRNKELMAAMEEKQQEVATTMYEIVEEAKDLTRQYYEAQMQSLKAEMEEMQEEYESKLKAYQSGDKLNTSDVGSSSKSLQNKVTHLMSVIAVLEEKLMREKMSRARAEEEVQHLRACIEERDEKSDNDDERNEVVLTDSESEEESDIDPANESLEPTFKKEDINKSRLARLSLVSNKNDVTQDSAKSDTIHEESVLETNATLKDADTTVKDATEVSEDESKMETDDIVNKTYNDQLSNDDKTDQDSETDRNSEDNKSDNKHYNRGTYYVSDGKISSDSDNKTDSNSETIPVTEGNKSNRSHRGTYGGGNVADSVSGKEKGKLVLRGTYFVKDTQDTSNDSFNKSKDSLLDTVSLNESELHYERDYSINHMSFKPSFSNDKSLDQFEQTEKATDAETVKEVNIKVERKEKQMIIESAKNASKIEKNFNRFQSNEGNLSLAQFEQFEKAAEHISIKDSTSNIETSLLRDTKSYKSKEMLVKETRNIVTEKVNSKFSSISLKTHDSDVSLAQFEQLEKCTEKYETREPSLKLNAFANVKPLKEKRLFFKDNEDDIIFKNEKPQSLIKLPDNKEKKTYFDNITTNVQPVSKVTELQKIAYDDRSPSIIKDECTKDFEPNKIKKLLGESFTRTEVNNSVTKLSKTLKKPASMDIFESPNVVMNINEKYHENTKFGETQSETEIKDRPEITGNTKIELKSQDNKKHIGHDDKMDQSLTETLKSEVLVSGNIDLTTSETSKSLKEEIIQDNLDQKLNSKENIVESIKESIEKMVLDQKTITDNDKPETVFKKPMILVTNNDVTQPEVKPNDTINEFENIYKDLSNTRATEFELLVSQNTSTNTNESNEGIECKYNLRHNIDTPIVDKKKKAKENTKPDENKSQEVLLESQSKCESKPKRNLRLRRRKNQEDDIHNEGEEKAKLKDIVNLQKEFCDVTLDKPAAKKVVNDIPSPEKKDWEKNEPIMEAQSCPSKSVTRSRRKLFTPRAEPLEESIGPTGDSNERVRVPRPSYHRVRARRKL